MPYYYCLDNFTVHHKELAIIKEFFYFNILTIFLSKKKLFVDKKIYKCDTNNYLFVFFSNYLQPFNASKFQLFQFIGAQKYKSVPDVFQLLLKVIFEILDCIYS